MDIPKVRISQIHHIIDCNKTPFSLLKYTLHNQQANFISYSSIYFRYSKLTWGYKLSLFPVVSL